MKCDYIFKMLSPKDTQYEKESIPSTGCHPDKHYNESIPSRCYLLKIQDIKRVYIFEVLSPKDI